MIKNGLVSGIVGVWWSAQAARVWYRVVAEIQASKNAKAANRRNMQMLVFLPSDVGERITCEPSVFN